MFTPDVVKHGVIFSRHLVATFYTVVFVCHWNGEQNEEYMGTCFEVVFLVTGVVADGEDTRVLVSSVSAVSVECARRV